MTSIANVLLKGLILWGATEEITHAISLLLPIYLGLKDLKRFSESHIPLINYRTFTQDTII